MGKYPKLKNFWFPERIDKAITKIMKHHRLASQAETVRFLINKEVKRLDGAKHAPK